jgi:flagellar basal body-associated protein FliL
MSGPRCSRCGAELLPEVNFCRQCGAAADSSSGSSELPTAVFGQTSIDPSTRRLNARATSAEQGFHGNAASAGDQKTGRLSFQKRWMPVALIVVVLALVTVALITWVNFSHTSRSSTTTASFPLVYPSSKIIVDTTSDEGRAIHLQTEDSIDRVVAWYTANLKPTKTMRLTPTTIVLRNQNVTATVAVEDNKTNILIKQAR